MTHEWKVEKPQILISVTGGAKSFRLKPRLRDMFENGLRKVLYFFIFGFEPLRFARLFDLKILIFDVSLTVCFCYVTYAV